VISYSCKRLGYEDYQRWRRERSLQELLEETATSHEPIQIVSDASNGILVSEEDWRVIQETLYLLSIPGISESIREGMATSIEECSKELNW
jgi:antitoxin YefM